MDLVSLVENKEIKIANKTYKIKVVDKIKSGQYLGRTIHGKDRIVLAASQNQASFIDTLLHEILHCIWYVQGAEHVTDSEHLEEFIVNSITVNLIGIFQKNPWLLDLLKEA